MTTGAAGRLEHAVRMHELIGDSRLAVLPDTTHMSLMRRTDLVVPMAESFLPLLPLG